MPIWPLVLSLGDFFGGLRSQGNSGSMGEAVCSQLRSGELLMKPTALPANSPGPPLSG